MPASFAGNLFNWLDSSGAVNAQLLQTTALTQLNLFSPTGGTTRAGLGLGLNGYGSSGAALAGVFGGLNISGTFSPTSNILFVANESQSSGHLGTDMYFAATPPGSATRGQYWVLKGTGDSWFNATGAALPTTNTTGFVHFPNMASAPNTTPSVTTTGATPFVYDTAGNVFFANITGSTWNDMSGGVVESPGISTAYTLLPTDKIVAHLLALTPKTDTLASAASCIGHEVTILVTGGSANLTVAAASGDSIFYQNSAGSITVGGGSIPTFKYYVKLTATASGKWYVTGGQ
jgi:hypothetical protein